MHTYVPQSYLIVPEIFLICSQVMFLFNLFCLMEKSHEFVLLSALTEISKMDSLTGQQLIKADGSSHAAEAALDGKVSKNKSFSTVSDIFISEKLQALDE